MRINITGTRPGKPAPRGGGKQKDVAPVTIIKSTRGQKVLERRATARARRVTTILEKYNITYRPGVVGCAIPGNEDFERERTPPGTEDFERERAPVRHPDPKGKR